LFKVGASVMYDAEGKASADIAVSMVQTEKTVEITYTPNAEWLNAEDRVYPVTIDPETTTTTNRETSNIEDVSFYYMIFSQDDILSETPYLKIGADNFTYIKFHTVPDIPAGATLSGSSLVLQGSSLQIYDEYAPFYVDIRTPSVDWDEDSFVYTEGQEYAETLPTNQTVTLNNITFDYNEDEENPNYVLELSLHGFYTTTEGYTSFHSSDNGFELSSDPSYEFVAHSSEYDEVSYHPALVVRYDEGEWEIPDGGEGEDDYPTYPELSYDTIDGNIYTGLNSSKSYRLINFDSSKYVTYGSSMSVSNYSQANYNQKINFTRSTFDSTYTIFFENSSSFLYYTGQYAPMPEYTLGTISTAVNLPDTAKWQIYDYISDDVYDSDGNVIENGDNYVIASYSDSRVVLAQATNGALTLQGYAHTDNQHWKVENFYNLYVVNMEIYHIYEGETWKLISDKTISEIGNHDNAVISAPPYGQQVTGNAGGYSNLKIYHTDNTPEYTITFYVTSLGTTETSLTFNTNLVYKIINTETFEYLCLGKTSSSVEYDTPGVAPSQNNAPWEMWRFEYVEGYYKIINMTNDYLLSSTSGNVSSTDTNTTHDDHLWRIVNKNGSYAIIPKSYPSQHLMQSWTSVELSEEYTTECGWSIEEYVCDNYYPGTINCNSTTLYWNITSNALSRIDKSIFENAINAWKNISNIDFVYVGDSTTVNTTNSNTYILFDLGDMSVNPEAQMVPYTGNNQTGNEISNHDQDFASVKILIYLRNNEHWTQNDQTNIAYNTAILMHEIGHALKLAHPTNSSTPSVMQTEGVTGANFVPRITNYDKSALIHKWGESNE